MALTAAHAHYACLFVKPFLMLTSPWHPPLRCDNNGVGCCRGGGHSLSSCWTCYCCRVSQIVYGAPGYRTASHRAYLFLQPSCSFPRLTRDCFEDDRLEGTNPTQAGPTLAAHSPFLLCYPLLSLGASATHCCTWTAAAPLSIHHHLKHLDTSTRNRPCLSSSARSA